jgi:hypothetical protein
MALGGTERLTALASGGSLKLGVWARDVLAPTGVDTECR